MASYGSTPTNTDMLSEQRQRVNQLREVDTLSMAGGNLGVAFMDWYESVYNPDAAASVAGAQRNAAKRQLDIARKRVDFQLRTGLRDIKQGRTDGIRSAINNALQRGIYRSGIRIENEERVDQDADNAESDLRQQIEFALADLAAQRSSLNASAAGDVNLGLPSPAEAKATAATLAGISTDSNLPLIEEQSIQPVEPSRMPPNTRIEPPRFGGRYGRT